MMNADHFFARMAKRKSSGIDSRKEAITSAVTGSFTSLQSDCSTNNSTRLSRTTLNALGPEYPIPPGLAAHIRLD